MPLRSDVKRVLARLPSAVPTQGVTMLIYHRVGGPGEEELDVRTEDFAAQMELLAAQEVTALDDALDGLRRGDRTSRFVLTFDDGFADVYAHAWPILRSLGLPFTVYVASSYIGGEMRWEGSTARNPGGPALSWDELGEMVGSGLCTLGNHTHSHVRPELLSEEELDWCGELLTDRLGVTAVHFAYPWGVPVPRLEPALRSRFVSAATGRLGRNGPSTDPLYLKRVPVRRSDPLAFFSAKVEGSLLPERLYGGMVAAAKKAGAHA